MQGPMALSHPLSHQLSHPLTHSLALLNNPPNHSSWSYSTSYTGHHPEALNRDSGIMQGKIKNDAEILLWIMPKKRKLCRKLCGIT